MKITNDSQEAFLEMVESEGMRAAMDLFQAQISDDLWNHHKQCTMSVKNMQREIRQHGVKVALENLQWRMGAKLLKDSGAKKVTTTYA